MKKNKEVEMAEKVMAEKVEVVPFEEVQLNVYSDEEQRRRSALLSMQEARLCNLHALNHILIIATDCYYRIDTRNTYFINGSDTLNVVIVEMKDKCDNAAFNSSDIEVNTKVTYSLSDISLSDLIKLVVVLIKQYAQNNDGTDRDSDGGDNEI